MNDLVLLNKIFDYDRCTETIGSKEEVVLTVNDRFSISSWTHMLKSFKSFQWRYYFNTCTDNFYSQINSDSSFIFISLSCTH